jgi:hypothetical protein
MSEFVAITYMGKLPSYNAYVNKRTYEFEWRKSLGIGSRSEEVRLEDAMALAQYRDRRGKKMFFLEKSVI